MLISLYVMYKSSKYITNHILFITISSVNSPNKTNLFSSYYVT